MPLRSKHVLMRLGLSARLLLLGLGATLLVTCVGGWVLRENVHAAIKRGFEQRLNEHAERIFARLETGPDGDLILDRTRSNDEFGQIFSGWYWQIDGESVHLSSRSLWDAERIVPISGTADKILLHANGPRGETLLGITKPVELKGKNAILLILGPADSIERELLRLDRILGVTLLILVLVLSITTWIQVRLGLQPLRRLRYGVSAVKEGVAERVGDNYGPDLNPLAQELDEMLARNARVVMRGRAHAADLSHALKKPLALLGAELGLGKQTDSRFAMEQVHAMSGLIDRHLTRSVSAGHDNAVAGRRIILSSVLTPLLSLMRSLHQGKNLLWDADMVDEVAWRGESTDLEEVLGNLLDNAGKWAKARVYVTASQQDDMVQIIIEDDGQGLDDEQIAQAARRGQRFDESVEGSGLGLAIAADIAETYGGYLTLGRSALGGLRAALHLPR